MEVCLFLVLSDPVHFAEPQPFSCKTALSEWWLSAYDGPQVCHGISTSALFFFGSNRSLVLSYSSERADYTFLSPHQKYSAYANQMKVLLARNVVKFLESNPCGNFSEMLSFMEGGELCEASSEEMLMTHADWLARKPLKSCYGREVAL